jgi:hypothetical protein
MRKAIKTVRTAEPVADVLLEQDEKDNHLLETFLENDLFESEVMCWYNERSDEEEEYYENDIDEEEIFCVCPFTGCTCSVEEILTESEGWEVVKRQKSM